MKQPNAMPTNKVAAGAFAGAIASVLAWALSEFGGHTLPPGIEGAFTVIVTFVVSYMVPNADHE